MQALDLFFKMCSFYFTGVKIDTHGNLAFAAVFQIIVFALSESK